MVLKLHIRLQGLGMPGTFNWTSVVLKHSRCLSDINSSAHDF